MLHFTTTLLQWRKTSKAVCQGTLTHFIPEDGIYVYFRQYEKETVMVIMNNNDTDKEVATGRFREILGSFSAAREVIGNTQVEDLSTLRISGKSVRILELR
jgi:hypothetical protein